MRIEPCFLLRDTLRVMIKELWGRECSIAAHDTLLVCYIYVLIIHRRSHRVILPSGRIQFATAAVRSCQRCCTGIRQVIDIFISVTVCTGNIRNHLHGNIINIRSPVQSTYHFKHNSHCPCSEINTFCAFYRSHIAADRAGNITECRTVYCYSWDRAISPIHTKTKTNFLAERNQGFAIAVCRYRNNIVRR